MGKHFNLIGCATDRAMFTYIHVLALVELYKDMVQK